MKCKQSSPKKKLKKKPFPKTKTFVKVCFHKENICTRKIWYRLKVILACFKGFYK